MPTIRHGRLPHRPSRRADARQGRERDSTHRRCALRAQVGRLPRHRLSRRRRGVHPESRPQAARPLLPRTARRPAGRRTEPVERRQGSVVCLADSSSSASSEQGRSSITACRCPRAAKRAGIVASVKSPGSQSASSSHVSGAETRASGVGRTEYAAARPIAGVLVVVEEHAVTFLLPPATGGEGLHHRRHLANLRPGDAGHRIEIDTQFVGMVEVVGAHRVGMQFEAREVGPSTRAPPDRAAPPPRRSAPTATPASPRPRTPGARRARASGRRTPRRRRSDSGRARWADHLPHATLPVPRPGSSERDRPSCTRAPGTAPCRDC